MTHSEASNDYIQRDGSTRSEAVRRSFERYALPSCFFLFMCSISRIGLDFLPPTTNFSWALAYASLIIAAAARPNLYLALARRNAVPIMAALFATCSALWSLTPLFSAYSGILLLLNVLVGFVIAERIGIQRTIIFVFCFCLIVQSASLILIILRYPQVFDQALNAKGLYLHKNALAMHAGILYFTAWVLFAAGWRRPISVIGILIALTCLLLARSGTGLLTAFFTTTVLLSCGVAASGRRFILLVSGLLLIAAGAIMVGIYTFDYDISSGALNALGKDETLSGRTLLWDQALKSFEEHPWFGLGFNSFWNSSETAAPSIWVATGQVLQSFHNIYLDRLVDVGAVGLAPFIAFLVLVLYRSWQQFLIQRSAIWAWPFTYVCFVTFVSFSEYPIFGNNEYQLLLSFIAAATCGLQLDARHFRS